jgi:hypothetical protein
MEEEVPELNRSLPLLESACGGLFNIVAGFMEVQVNLQSGSRWSAEDLFTKCRSPMLTVESDSVVEKVSEAVPVTGRGGL